MSQNKRRSFAVSGRKGASAAAVALAVILSLAIGGGASWFFKAGAEAQAREALRRAQEERQRQSQQALAQLQQEVQAGLEKAAEQLQRLNYGMTVDELQEAIDKCDLVTSALVEEDRARASALRKGLEEAKALAQAGNPEVLEKVKQLRSGRPPEGGYREPSGKEQPQGPIDKPEHVVPPEKAAPGEVPPVGAEEPVIPPGKAEETPEEKQGVPQPPSLPPFAP